MAIDLILNASTHDVVVESGDLVLATEDTQVAQNVKIRLLTWQGEWLLDVSMGVDYLDQIFSVSTSLDVKRAIIKQAIMATPGVKDIVAFDFGLDHAAGGAQIDFVGTTDYGEITVEVQT